MRAAADPLPRLGAGMVLRRLSSADLPALQACRSYTGLGRKQGWSAMPNGKARAFLDEMHTLPLFRPGEWAQIGISEPQDGTVLGDIGLCIAEDARSAEIGFTLARPAQGRGLATAAAEAPLHLILECTTVERIFAITERRNCASIGLLERIGMRRR